MNTLTIARGFGRWAGSTSLAALALGGVAQAQTETTPPPDETIGSDVIIVTAQRQAQSLQAVPIAVSAFSGEMLEEQQIENPADLQLTLPNVTFTKTNFTTSSFTIRGIGDLCTGVACDSATAIHLDGTPLLSTRLFETEFYDLERLEVLRGPQGTLFGRNATSGVVNFIPARPDLTGFSAGLEAEYGNYDAVEAKGFVNVALTDTIGVRIAGIYQNRDGYTKNLFDGRRIDGRDVYSIRGTLRFEPTDTTTIDLLASYFRENDNRLRIQKQVCQRDPTGYLGCLNLRRDPGVVNGNSTFFSTVPSREFFALNGLPTAFGLGSIYGPDIYATAINPASKRRVSVDFTPTYFSDEEQYQARIEQQLGALKLQLTGFYHKTRVDSRQDYSGAVQNRALFTPALSALAAAAAGVAGLPTGSAAYFAPVAAALIPGGPGGAVCTSLPVENGTGVYGGNGLCTATPQDNDRSVQDTKDWSVEGILTSDFDGKFNFLLGAIYADQHLTENSYYVTDFGIDYASGVLGAFQSLARAALAAIPGAVPPPPGYLATPFFRNNSDDYTLKSYGLFGEAYYEFNDKLKLTLGARYNSDKKTVRARSPLLNFLTPFNLTDPFASPFINGYAVTGAPSTSRLAPFDADPTTPCGIASTTGSGTLSAANTIGCELFQERKAEFDEWTGRGVLDYQITPENLIYASYSRGYKSGGINPPLQPGFAIVPENFEPELIDAFEIGSKNSFMDGQLILNLTGFYYKYKKLQLSRIVARTSVNDNVDAEIYGIEAEAVIRPTREFVVNLGASYLHSKVSEDKFLSNPRDPSGGRSDAVVIKDITLAANCGVAPRTAGNVAGANAFVNFVNSQINGSTLTSSVTATGTQTTLTPRTAANPNAAPLQGTTPLPTDSGIAAATGAFSVCQVLQNVAALAGTNFDPNGILVSAGGIEVNIRGNQLPQAPKYKFSAGAQYTHEFASGWSLVPRVDLSYTGEQQSSIFGGNINKIKGFVQMNAQVQLNASDERWFVRGFVQNIFDSGATTGLYVADASTGLFTNIFSLDPRRYGIGAGVKF